MINILTVIPELLRQLKQLSFSDRQLTVYLSTNELAVCHLYEKHSVFPFVRQINAVTAEFLTFTNYLYTTYNAVEHDVNFQDHGVMVLGSGMYQIRSSVKFDWCIVRATRMLCDQGLPTVMANYNQKTAPNGNPMEGTTWG